MSAGLPYHRMALLGRRGWWWPLVGTLLLLVFSCVVVGLLFSWLSIAALLAGVDMLDQGERLFSDPMWEEAALLATLAALLPATAAAAWVARGRLGTLASIACRVRWGWLGRCALLAVPALILLFGGYAGLELLFPTAPEVADSHVWVGWSRFLIGLVVVLALVPLQAAAEEYLVRGWLLQLVGGYLRSPWPAILVTALVFALLHGLSKVSGFLGLVLFSVVIGWLTIRTGGLEAAVAYHAISNVFAFALSAAFGGLGFQGDLTAADAGWTLPAVEAVVLPLYAAAVVWRHWRTGQHRVTSRDVEYAAPAWRPDGTVRSTPS